MVGDIDGDKELIQGLVCLEQVVVSSAEGRNPWNTSKVIVPE